jgi:hypothetical protein
MHVYVYKRKRSTFVGGESGAVEVDNVVHKLVQERRVVRDAHERLLPLAQVTLEPDAGLKTAINNNKKKWQNDQNWRGTFAPYLQVEMVVGLIEEEEVRLGEESARDGDAHTPAARVVLRRLRSYLQGRSPELE